MLLQPIVTQAITSFASSLPPPASLATISATASTAVAPALVNAAKHGWACGVAKVVGINMIGGAIITLGSNNCHYPLSPPPPNTSPAFVTVLDTIRRGGGGGGTATSAPLDMNLVNTRLEGLSYNIVTALTTIASLRIFQFTPKKQKPLPDHDDGGDRSKVRLHNTFALLFSLTMAISVALGVYTTMLFSLMSIYSKTALGMGLTLEFQRFFDACKPLRVNGFHASITALASFGMGWVFSLILNFDGRERWLIALPAFVVGVLATNHYWNILQLASKLIFS